MNPVPPFQRLGVTLASPLEPIQAHLTCLIDFMGNWDVLLLCIFK